MFYKVGIMPGGNQTMSWGGWGFGLFIIKFLSEKPSFINCGLRGLQNYQ